MTVVNRRRFIQALGIAAAASAAPAVTQAQNSTGSFDNDWGLAGDNFKDAQKDITLKMALAQSRNPTDAASQSKLLEARANAADKAEAAVQIFLSDPGVKKEGANFLITPRDHSKDPDYQPQNRLNPYAISHRSAAALEQLSLIDYGNPSLGQVIGAKPDLKAGTLAALTTLTGAINDASSTLLKNIPRSAPSPKAIAPH